jgi:hypothetical protein
MVTTQNITTMVYCVVVILMHNQLERIMSHKLLSNFPEFEKIAEEFAANF